MYDDIRLVPSYTARVTVQPQRGYVIASTPASAEQLHRRTSGLVPGTTPDYCLAVSSLVPMRSRRCPSPLLNGGGVQQGDDIISSKQPPPSYSNHHQSVVSKTIWNYQQPPSIVSSTSAAAMSSSTTTFDASFEGGRSDGSAAALGIDGALRVKLLQLQMLQQQQQHLATRRGRTPATDSDDGGSHGCHAAVGRQPGRRVDIDTPRTRSQSAVGRRQIVIESSAASRPASSSSANTMFFSTPTVAPHRGGVNAGDAAATVVEASMPNRRMLNFAPARAGGMRSLHSAPETETDENRSVIGTRGLNSMAHGVPAVPRSTSSHQLTQQQQQQQREAVLRRTTNERNTWLHGQHPPPTHPPPPHQQYCHSPGLIVVDGSVLPASQSVVDDVLYREAAEYVIAARPTMTTSSPSAVGVTPWEVDELLRSINLVAGGDNSSSTVAGLASNVVQNGTDSDETTRSRRRRPEQPPITLNAGLQRVERQVPGASAGVKRSATVNQLPLVQPAARRQAVCGSSGGSTDSVTLGPQTVAHRRSADGDLESHAASSTASNSSTFVYEHLQRNCWRQGSGDDVVVRNRPVTVGLWVGLATKTGVRRRVVATPAGSTSSITVDGTWCSACCRHVTSLDQSSVADGRLYHNDCLSCCICQRSLHNKPLYSAAGSIYCENDYLYVGFQRNADLCSICGNMIVDAKLQAMGKSFHPDCFQCKVCGVSLDETPFTVDIHSQVYCIPDYTRLYAPKCSVCCQAVIPRQDGEYAERLVALDRNFHPSCFRCEDCGTQLIDGGKSVCYPLDSRPLCVTCHGHRLQNRSGSHEVQSPSPQPPPGYQQHYSYLHQELAAAVDAAGFHRVPDIYVDAPCDRLASSSFPVVDASIDDDQASWASSINDVIASQRQQPTQHQQQRHLSEDTSSIASSIDREEDVTYDVITATTQSNSVAKSRSPLDFIDDLRVVKSTGNEFASRDDEDDAREDRRVLRHDKGGQLEDEEDEDDEEPVARSDSAASSCGCGVDSGHGSRASDDTLTSSSDVETLDASTGSTPTTMTSVDDGNNDLECLELNDQFTGERIDGGAALVRHRSDISTTSSSELDSGKTVPATTTAVPASKVNQPLSSTSRRSPAVEPTALQLNFLDLDPSYRVTDL